MRLNFEYFQLYNFMEVLIFCKKPPYILLGTFVWERILAYFPSLLTDEKTGDFQPLLIQLKMGIEKGDCLSIAA